MSQTKSRFKRVNVNKAALLLCSPVLAASLAVHAEEARDNETYRFTPIIVNAQANAVDDDANDIVAEELWVGGKVATSVLDTPASVSVITEKEIEQRNVSTTEELLEYTPGVITDFYGTDDRNDYFQIRGFQATTYRDGLTLGSMRGVREDAYAYERVEVLRGANSTLFGPADPGGSVNFVSKRPKFEKFGSGYVTYGSFDHKEVGLDLGDSLNEDATLAYRFTAKIEDSDREYDHSKNDNEFVMGGLTWEPTDFTSATLILDYLNRDSSPNSGGYPLDREYDRDEFFGESAFNYHEVERTSVTGQFTHDFDNGLLFRANMRYSDLTDDFGYIYLYDFAGRTGTDLSRFYFGTDGEAEEFISNAILQYDAEFTYFDSSTLAGLEYRDASSEDQSFYGDAAPINIANPLYSGAPGSLSYYSRNDRDYKTKSAFLQQNFSFNDKFIVTGGVRNDRLDLSSTDITGFKSSDDFSETSVRGALTYKWNQEVSTYISMVESVAPPSIGVTPERGKQYEIGMKYAPINTNALFSVSVYDLEKDDVTIAVVQENGIIERETIGESEVQGVDFEAKIDLTEQFSLTGGYSYMETEVVKGTLRSGTSIKGKEFTAAPKHMASVWGHYTLPNRYASFGLGVRYTGSYYFDTANTAKSESATIVDGSFTYHFYQGTDFTLFVRNLFDDQHVVGSGTADYYNPGREITATLNHKW
ncbi:Ferrichrome-iron receptor [Methylophaga frappieri]|uniref:Ferrichrome-iron receptor n=1 Tax=Methylophaga frappieri (strain ATCC BAA-2434 / DSM 25690 / JAM7) TaxID=754477 RepID=I1YGV4_METFJ|nr:TonB-dependent siderophore receptor [Methylophaga frappieri]AFJ02147.1 Ferrichrome-iron receptor [Methylophaga frappieri]